MIQARWPWLAALTAFSLALAPSILRGQEEVSGRTTDFPGGLRVSLVTIGQGDLVWERFGHNALLFQDVNRGLDAAYHWGVFDFQQVDFIPRLIRGTMLYGMGKSDLDTLLRGYRMAGRPVWIQELALTPSQARDLLSLVEENYLPENREYRYDYYRDNCSTRIRDMLDRVLKGNLAEAFQSESTEHSFRWHTRRVLREMPAYYLGIQFVLGPNGDRPISVWEEMFLPPTLMERIREIRVEDGAGATRPLVRSEQLLLDTGRSDPPASPPFAFPVFLALGLIWGGAFFWLTRPGVALSIPRRSAVFLLGGTWSIIAAVGGSLLLAAWLFTDHYFWYANYNLFQVNPLFFPLFLGFLLFLFTGRFPLWGRRLAALLGGMALVGFALELVPGLGQKNAELLGFALPLNLALWAGAARLQSVGHGPAEEMADGTE